MSKTVNTKMIEAEMKAVLKEIIATGNINGPSDSDSSQFYMQCLNECLKHEYLTGINIVRTANGKLRGQPCNPTVTRAGVCFLEGKDADARSRKAYTISLIALCISALTFLFNVVVNLLTIL